MTRDGAVSALDLGDVKRRLNRTASDTTTGPSSYSVFADVNADGKINAVDLALVKQRLNSRVPATQPAQPAIAVAPLLPISPTPPSATRDLFATTPLLG